MKAEKDRDSPPDVTVIICTVPKRAKQAIEKFAEISSKFPKWEILLIGDNKKRSIGKKREAGLKLAQGKYITWLDDDDDFTDFTYEEVNKALEEDKDIIAGYQLAIINGVPGFVEFDLNCQNETWIADGFTKRQPFPHGNFWKRELVQDVPFPDLNDAEDWGWAKIALEKIKSQSKIKKVIHIYNHDDRTSEAMCAERSNRKIRKGATAIKE